MDELNEQRELLCRVCTQSSDQLGTSDGKLEELKKQVSVLTAETVSLIDSQGTDNDFSKAQQSELEVWL